MNHLWRCVFTLVKQGTYFGGRTGEYFHTICRTTRMIDGACICVRIDDTSGGCFEHHPGCMTWLSTANHTPCHHDWDRRGWGANCCSFLTNAKLMTHPKLQILITVTLRLNHFAKECQHQHGETLTDICFWWHSQLYWIKVSRKQPREHVISASLVSLQDMICSLWFKYLFLLLTSSLVCSPWSRQKMYVVMADRENSVEPRSWKYKTLCG